MLSARSCFRAVLIVMTMAFVAGPIQFTGAMTAVENRLGDVSQDETAAPTDATIDEADNNTPSTGADSHSAPAGTTPPPPADPVATVMGTLRDAWKGFLAHLPFVIAGLAILLLTWLIASLVDKFASTVILKSHWRDSLQDLAERMLVIFVWLAGIMLAAMVMFPGLTPTKAIAALGIGSVAIGFAFKDIFENFLAGILILLRFPMEPGDFIECEGDVGKIEEITVRNTLLRTTEGVLVIIPNATLFKNPVDVLTSRKVRRITVICGVGYDEDVDASRDVIRQAVKDCKTVEQDQPIEIFAQEFGASSVNFEVTWWTGSSPLQQRESRDEVVAAVKRALDDADIEIPFPYRTLTFSEPLKTKSFDNSQAHTTANHSERDS